MKQFESHLQTVLKHLIQISITKHSDAETVKTLKQLYSFTLQSNINRNDENDFSKHLIQILNKIQEANVIKN